MGFLDVRRSKPVKPAVDVPVAAAWRSTRGPARGSGALVIARVRNGDDDGDDGASRVVEDALADRAQDHAGETTEPSGAHHDVIGNPLADSPSCVFAPSALLRGYQYRGGAERPSGPGPSGPAHRPAQRDAGGDARASATRPDLIRRPARPREATRDDVLVRPRCQRLGLVRDVGQHDPVLGTDHYRRRPAVPGLGPHRRAPPHPHPRRSLARASARREVRPR